jgi:2'-5' RNA ligase
MKAMIRSFIAVDLSAEVLGKLDQVYRTLRQRLPARAVRWTPVKNIHLTLKFLGDVSEGNLTALFGVLHSETEKRSAFEIQVGGLGAFPSARRPRVIWVGVQAPPELEAIQHAIDLETARLGYASEERGFSPHLTLGRVSRQATPEEVRKIGEVIAEVQAGDLGACRIDAVHYYRSDLNPQGAIYTRLYTAPLRT